MPPTSLRSAQNVLQEPLTIIPHNGQKPNWWLFIIIVSSITGFALLATAVGCLVATGCCRRNNRNRKEIEKRAAANIEDAQRIQYAQSRSSSRSSTTLANEEDDLIGRRTANLLAAWTFEGHEKKSSANHKKAILNKSWRRSAVAMPVTLASLRKLPMHNLTAPSEHLESQETPNPAPTIPAPRGAWPTLAIPSFLGCTGETNTAFEEPARLVGRLAKIYQTPAPIRTAGIPQIIDEEGD